MNQPTPLAAVFALGATIDEVASIQPNRKIRRAGGPKTRLAATPCRTSSRTPSATLYEWCVECVNAGPRERPSQRRRILDALLFDGMTQANARTFLDRLLSEVRRTT